MQNTFGKQKTKLSNIISQERRAWHEAWATIPTERLISVTSSATPTVCLHLLECGAKTRHRVPAAASPVLRTGIICYIISFMTFLQRAPQNYIISLFVTLLNPWLIFILLSKISSSFLLLYNRHVAIPHVVSV